MIVKSITKFDRFKIRGHSLSAYANFSERLATLSPWCVYKLVAYQGFKSASFYGKFWELTKCKNGKNNNSKNTYSKSTDKYNKTSSESKK